MSQAKKPEEFSLLVPKNAREPLKTHIFLMKCYKLCAMPLVGDLYHRNWSLKNFRVAHLTLLIAWTLTLYTWNSISLRHNPNQMFLSIVALLFDLLGIQRFQKFLFSRDFALILCNNVRDFTEKWEKRSEGYQILVWYFNLIKIVVISGMVTFFAIAIVLSFAPILIFVVTGGRMQLVYPMYVPHVDFTTHPGFELHVFLHMYAIVFFIDALTPLVGVVFSNFVMICARIDILCARMLILSQKVDEQNEENSRKSLHEIIVEHQELLKYIDMCEELFSMQHLTDHGVVAAQICLSLYSLMKHSWYLGIAVIFIGTFMLFTVDFVGTIILVKLEKLLNEVWNVPWYLLDSKNKSSFCFLLANAQKVDRLSIGGRYPLSLDTFVELYKRIYSYLMILMEMES
ncbi:odorant receptor 43a-like [Culicoides brevitarsis]|uniref:odorant receptor 43a-like n=1 Tax=Culicoides brevitarsis TaxID=469753 RepID=UPI00307BF990